MNRFDEELKEAIAEGNVEATLAVTMQAMFNARTEAERLAVEAAEADKPKKKITKAQITKAEKEAAERTNAEKTEIAGIKGEDAVARLAELTEELKAGVESDVQDKIDDLEAIRVMDLLTEARFR